MITAACGHLLDKRGTFFQDVTPAFEDSGFLAFLRVFIIILNYNNQLLFKGGLSVIKKYTSKLVICLFFRAYPINSAYVFKLLITEQQF